MTLLIHPGLHKTGTTYLQERVFAGDPAFRSVLTHAQVDRLLVRPHDFRWTPEPARQALADVDPANSLPVLSSEILVGNPLFGARDAVQLAERLHAVGPDARVLLTVRRQGSLASALYQQYLKRGGTEGPHAFFLPAREPGYHGFDPTVLLYHHYADLYARLWGAERVLVLPQEHLARDGTDAVRRIAAHAGRELPAGWTAPARDRTGRGPPVGGHGLFRLANRLRRGPVNPGGPALLTLPGDLLYGAAWRMRRGGQRERRRVEAAVAAATPAGVAASNRALQRYCPVDLAELGYDMGTDGS